MANHSESASSKALHRRRFLELNGAAAALTSMAPVSGLAQTEQGDGSAHVIRFEGPDSLVHGQDWETLNPGFWQVKGAALRRRLANYGDRARATGFPFHYETHRRNGGIMDVAYDPSLPEGCIYHRQWKLSGDFALEAVLTYRGRKLHKREGDSEQWKMFQRGYGLMGLVIGAKNLFESYHKTRHATVVGWTDDGRFSIVPKGKKNKQPTSDSNSANVPRDWNPGDRIEISVEVQSAADGMVKVVARLRGPDGAETTVDRLLPKKTAEGYIGIVGRGLVDFEVNQLTVRPGENKPHLAKGVDCYTCYPLGDTLRKVDGKWHVRFVGLFASDGRRAEVRVSDQEHPEGGWGLVPVAGEADIVNNRWRRNTASIPVELPHDPSASAMYYTVWKDGVNVTADSRIGSAGTGPGTGYVGDVPSRGDYVGRLPQLRAPYKICGLSCHAITSGLQHRAKQGWNMLGGGDDWQFRDQPTVEAYRHLEDYEFQIMCWEDDVWYMELVFYPPSTDDAYKVVTTTIAGPTSRWQMMRHWNVINPGDHDYGMDDVKGPEQIVIRQRHGLGQDRDYMRRNFQIVQHLITGDEEVDPLANPKKWRAWKMPRRDFTLAILDARLWRSSQDTAIWDDEGWGADRTLYDRSNPTRSLLGEEQFAWLQELVRTDSSRLICLTGLNGLHTVWTGGNKYSNTEQVLAQRDRVAADYAGWVAAGADRVIQLLGTRDGIVTVYGDVHNGCVMKNSDHGVIECSFGPIGRSGGRGVIPGFGPRMKDVDGRPLEVTALYHKQYANARLERHGEDDPFYWNFLEMEFDPERAEPTVGLRIRNMVDAPTATPRGGNALETTVAKTGRSPSSWLPARDTLPHADVRVVSIEGKPIRGTRTDAQGRLRATPLVDVPPETEVIVTVFDGQRSESHVARTTDA